jgi:hypothetical protein
MKNIELTNRRWLYKFTDWRRKKPKRGKFRHRNWRPTSSLDRHYGLLVTLKFSNPDWNTYKKGLYRPEGGGRSKKLRSASLKKD